MSTVQRQVFSALSQIAKHNVDLAEMVVEADIFPSVLTSLRDVDEYVKKNTATLIREISKHTPEVNRSDLLSDHLCTVIFSYVVPRGIYASETWKTNSRITKMIDVSIIDVSGAFWAFRDATTMMK